MNKNKKATINPINEKDHKCFHYAVTVALNHGEVKRGPQRITKIRPFINTCNWVGINYQKKITGINLKKII